MQASSDEAERAAPPVKETVTVADASVSHALAQQTVRSDTAVPSATATRSHIVRWLMLASAAIVLALGAVVACQRRAEPSDVAPSFSIEATPAGIDPSGAMVVKLRFVQRQ